jgi:hypothetical protein
MNEEQFEELFDSGDLDEQYSEYLMSHASIGNGDMLIRARENQNMYDDFKESVVTIWPFPLTLPVKQPNAPLPRFNPDNYEDAPL